MSHIGKAIENLKPRRELNQGKVEVKGKSMVSLNLRLSLDLADAP
jgi:hypothetical protein